MSAYENMKARVTGYQVIEGTFMHDALAPVGQEIDYLTDVILPAALDAHMPDTATGSDLDRVAAAYGMSRKPAAAAVGSVTLTGLAGSEIPKAVPVSTPGGIIFLTDAAVTLGTDGIAIVSVTAAQAGARANLPAGSVTVVPLAVAGLYEVTNPQPTTGGADTESDDSLRDRLLLKLRLPPGSGTQWDYIRWAREVQGVAAARCISLWNGPGTVKVIIAGEGMTIADQETIDRCAAHIEAVRPIGASVTIVSVTALTVNISANVDTETGYADANLAADFSDVVRAYFTRSAFDYDYLSHAQIGALLLTVTGVKDYQDLQLNGTSGNVALTSEQVPVLGEVTLT